jgi:uncharacterized protein
MRMRLTKLASLHRLGPDKSLLLNALSGAVDVVDDALRAKIVALSVGLTPELEDQELCALRDRGYLFASESEERSALNAVHESAQQLCAMRPLQFVFCPTYACNLACSYCFESAQLRSRAQVMSVQQVADAFAATEIIAPERSTRERQIVLFGGEPLLPTTKEVVGAILDRAESGGFSVQIVTNGTCLDQFAPLFSEHKALAMGAQITLDGPQSVHDARRTHQGGAGSFAQVVRGIETCLELGIKVNARMNVDAQNLDSLEEFADLLEARGWMAHPSFKCQLAPVTDHVGENPPPSMLREDQLVQPVLGLWRSRPELRQKLDFQLFRVLHHLISVIEGDGDSAMVPRFHYCEADRQDVHVFGPDGLVYICPESIGDRLCAVGTYSPVYRPWPRRLRGWRDRSVLTLPECQDCSIATFCGGGCGYAALRHHGSPAHGICAGAPEIVKAYIQELQQRASQEQLPLAT